MAFVIPGRAANALYLPLKRGGRPRPSRMFPIGPSSLPKSATADFGWRSGGDRSRPPPGSLCDIADASHRRFSNGGQRPPMPPPSRGRWENAAPSIRTDQPDLISSVLGSGLGSGMSERSHGFGLANRLPVISPAPRWRGQEFPDPAPSIGYPRKL